MWKIDSKFSFYKQGIQFLLLTIIFLVALVFLSEELYGIFEANNYVTIHSLIEILIIFVSMTIAIQSWLISPYILSSTRMYVGALFFTIGLLEVAHILSYKGMPFFLKESTTYAATWFYMISRLLLPIVLLVILFLKERKIKAIDRWIVYSLSLVFAIIYVVLVFVQMPWMPPLVENASGPTGLKNTLQYLAMILQSIVLLFLIRYFKIAPRLMFLMIGGSILFNIK